MEESKKRRRGETKEEYKSRLIDEFLKSKDSHVSMFDKMEFKLYADVKLHIEDCKIEIKLREGRDSGDDQYFVYAVLVGNKVARIGSSKTGFRERMKETEDMVSTTLKLINCKPLPEGKVDPRERGGRLGTPEWEAKGWEHILKEFGDGVVYARAGTDVHLSQFPGAPIEKLNVYLDEESTLLGYYKPPLNQSWHR